jgi:hypothetical protein
LYDEGTAPGELLGRFIIGNLGGIGTYEKGYSIALGDRSNTTGFVDYKAFVDDVSGSPTEGSAEVTISAIARKTTREAVLAFNSESEDVSVPPIIEMFLSDGTNTQILSLEISGLSIGDYTLPWTDRTSNQVLQTDGSGQLSWEDPRPYDVYTVLLNQSGTGIPTATVLENTLGTVTFTREGPGQYQILSTGLFALNKTYIHIGSPSDGDYNSPGLATAYGVDNTSQISFSTGNPSVQDSLLLNTPLEIRIYN